MDNHAQIIDCLLDSWVRKNSTSWDDFGRSPALHTQCATCVALDLSSMYHSNNLTSPFWINERIQAILKNRRQLELLKQIPVIEQRTPIWYETRNNLITASDFGDALGIDKFGKKADMKKFYKKKVGIEPQPAYDLTSPALAHGVKYEPVATSIYQSRYGVTVYEFGLIKHPRHDFLGASPDGISDLGVMLEIKCPYKRIVNDSIMEQYYYQMQGQLDACDLDECDFLEATFEEYQDEDTFFDDYEEEYKVYTRDYREKGIIFNVYDLEKDKIEYIYSPHNVSKSELVDWMNAVANDLATDPTKNLVKKDHWFLKGVSIKRVYRNDSFISNMNIQLKDVWDTILNYRNSPSLYAQEIAGTAKPPRPPASKTPSKIGVDEEASQQRPMHGSQSQGSNGPQTSSTKPAKKARSLFILDESND